MAYDSSKDKILDTKVWANGLGGELHFSVIQYGDNEPKLNIGPRTYYKEDELRYRKPGRLSRVEVAYLYQVLDDEWMEKYF